MPEPRGYTVTLPSHEVGILEWGPATGELIIALHGFPDTAWTWRHVAPLLVDAGYRVVAPFLRGYAPTAIPADHDYSVRALAGDAIALHEAVGGDDRTVLLGHDWGAITAGAVAGDPASPYRRVVALAVPPLSWMNPTRATLRPWLAANVRQPRHSWYIAYNQIPGLAERTFAGLTRRLWRAWSPGYDATDELVRLSAAVPDREHARAVVSYYRALVGRGIRPALADPAVPVLYLQGDQDGALDARHFAVVQARVPRGSQAVLIRDAGHFLQLEQPAAVAAALLPFLAES